MTTALNEGIRAELVGMFAADQEQAQALFHATKDLPGARESFVFEWPPDQRPAEYAGGSAPSGDTP